MLHLLHLIKIYHLLVMDKFYQVFSSTGSEEVRMAYDTIAYM